MRVPKSKDELRANVDATSPVLNGLAKMVQLGTEESVSDLYEGIAFLSDIHTDMPPALLEREIRWRFLRRLQR